MRAAESIASPNFAAVLLAGGRSTRMGFDKATLVLEGEPLWQRQLGKLRALGPRELFISGRRDGPYAGAGVEIVEDAIPDLGPLAGIAAVLCRTECPRVLVLAIDLPAMSVEFLRELADDGRALVPARDEFFEPLAAVYPREALAFAEELLSEDDRSLQRFVRRLFEEKLVAPRVLRVEEEPLFHNVNRPSDVSGST